ncbi:MAG: hypothetical protein IIC66_09115 [candidate division Zixibacteria bacterium]|nr:hypothetical protein [candidate division Zixibacteria bacterium]
MPETKTKVIQTDTQDRKALTMNTTGSEKLNRIKVAMNAGEFSIGNLAKELKWPFQKVRHQVHAIAKKENKKLTSISRGIWSVQ